MFVIVSERRGGFHRGIVWWLHYLLKIFHSIYFRVLTIFCLNYRIYSWWIYPYNKRGGVTKQRILTCFTKVTLFIDMCVCVQTQKLSNLISMNIVYVCSTISIACLVEQPLLYGLYFENALWHADLPKNRNILHDHK